MEESKSSCGKIFDAGNPSELPGDFIFSRLSHTYDLLCSHHPILFVEFVDYKQIALFPILVENEDIRNEQNGSL